MSALKERCQSTMRSRGAVTTAPSPNRVSKGEIPPAPSRADQSAALFYYESTQHIKNKYITRDPSQPSLHSLCDPPKVGGMLTRCRPAEAKPHSARECPGASAQPRGLGPASPTHCAGLVTGHTQRSQPRALDAGTRPGAGSHIWSPHALGGRDPPENKD